ncbi:BlaI/MecI/CopY family transcriptional regulator [Undibacterium sp.]|jgi:predicted transcriptional regulator|uniref:BlaI/MecI/CopY family transcriptional regulator n=1 Tax=Undibacterium sp. TaxID=1914977 RepID=UPI002CB79C0E|nr:BlaI/MecI/CopY family transcriptional regulator [Undibacterium sp.]HTD04916.1 BlaI/MecI/CopY family transcriptional regulator [Undibacterium sp.]
MAQAQKTAGSSKPTAAELELLRLIWQSGPASAKQIHQAALEERPEITYATILRLMQIMHTKGLLIRDESQRSHIYAAAQAQDSLQSNLLKDLIHKAFSGSAKDLVMAALRGHVSQEERDEIQKFLHGDSSSDTKGEDK